MKESFSEYKKKIEQSLLNIDYLYSGDVISSCDREYFEIKKSPLTSSIFIINSIINIYNESFQNMIDKSVEVLIAEEGLSTFDKQVKIFDFIYSKGIGVSSVFASHKSKKFFEISSKPPELTPENRDESWCHMSLPGYFHSIDRHIDVGVESFYSPLIKEVTGESIMYVIDRPIQSFVWIIQNMDYIIEPISGSNTEWRHKIKYNFYDCDFKSYKIIIKNFSNIRESKINEILNGN